MDKHGCFDINDLTDLKELKEVFDKYHNVIISVICVGSVDVLVINLNYGAEVIHYPVSGGDPSGHLYIGVTGRGAFHFNLWEEPPHYGYIMEKLNLCKTGAQTIYLILDLLKVREG